MRLLLKALGGSPVPSGSSPRPQLVHRPPQASVPITCFTLQQDHIACASRTHRAYPCFPVSVRAAFCAPCLEHPSSSFIYDVIPPDWDSYLGLFSCEHFSCTPKLVSPQHSIFQFLFTYLSLVVLCVGCSPAVGGGCSPVAEHGLYGAWASVGVAQGFATLQHVGSSRIRDRTRVSCIGDSFPLSHQGSPLPILGNSQLH